MTKHYTRIEDCVDHIIQTVGRRLIIGTPLGLGKANLLLNAIYQRAVRDPELEVIIFTALTLEVPQPRPGLEERFMAPLIKRWFDGYPDLDYAVARSNGTLAPNVEVHEFFFRPGKFLGNRQAQQDYISTNYTHVARDMVSRGVNVTLQMVSPGKGDHDGRVSLSCNPDVTLELIAKMRDTDQTFVAVGEVNDQLPYLYGDADVSESFFDILYLPEQSYTLFSAPKVAVSPTDHLIGLHASALVRDDGTLQVGIGSLGDAVASALGVRHTDNSLYRDLIERISSPQSRDVQQRVGGLGIFTEGLYGATEMFVDGFLHLFRLGILSRRVYDDEHIQHLINTGAISALIDENTLNKLESLAAFEYPLTVRGATYLQSVGVIHEAARIQNSELSHGGEKIELPAARDIAHRFIVNTALGVRLRDPSVLHGGFYLGNHAFYQALRDLTEEERKLLKMTGVDRINQLYRGEALDRLQRHNSRFINTCLIVTLNGAVVSDGLDDNRVVSGVGGQYNFVAMAHALDHSRSIITLRSTYEGPGGVRSNILFNYGHCTIPRHLRDIIVTEYGSADLRGLSDSECAANLINIADSRFQNGLVEQAKSVGKLPADYKVPPEYRQNNPERVLKPISEFRDSVLPAFPLGTDLTDDEIALGGALKKLGAATGSRKKMARQIWKSMSSGSGAEFEHLLKMVGLDNPQSFKDRLTRRLLVSVLEGN